MDQAKTGRFLASLRRQNGWTQQALGERLGVSNKTVSRWERGNTLPDVEMLGLLAELYAVTVEDLLRGERAPESAAAPKPTPAPKAPNPFSLKERTAWLKRKWRREHAALLAALAALTAASLALPLLFHKPWLLGLAPILALAAYAWQYNRMMIYVEHHLYDQ
ncbi:MAG: helix-turn-helix domain-containing protein [Candidatus Spyradocola sp.]